jgi:hypothetical protein
LLLSSGLVAVLLAAGTGGTPDAGPTVMLSTSLAGAEGYCAYVEAISSSDRAFLVSPEFVGFFGVGNASNTVISSQAGSNNQSTTYIANPSVQLALQYRFGRLFESYANRSRAQADCDRYRYVSALHTFVEAYKSPELMPSALMAREAVLKEALPHADEILKATRDGVEKAKATVEELNATELRVDAMHAEALQTAEDIAAQARWARPPSGSTVALLEQRDVAEANLARKEIAERKAQSWDVVLRAGYNEIFGVKDQLPFFGSVGVVFNFGYFFQGDAMDRAAKGRSGWADAQTEGLNDRVRDALERLRATLATDKKRLQETKVLLADLEGRMQEVASLGGDRVKRYRDYLWFDLVKVRADYAFLNAQIRELQESLGEEPLRP